MNLRRVVRDTRRHVNRIIEADELDCPVHAPELSHQSVWERNGGGRTAAPNSALPASLTRVRLSGE
jgi:hypothetical protein